MKDTIKNTVSEVYKPNNKNDYSFNKDLFDNNNKNAFKKGEPKLKNPIQANNVYKFAKHFRSKYKSAAHQIAGVIQFAQTKKWEDEEKVNNFILRVDSYASIKGNRYPKDREDIKDKLEELYCKTDLEFNNYISRCND